jgi:hypothetical protein
MNECFNRQISAPEPFMDIELNYTQRLVAVDSNIAARIKLFQTFMSDYFFPALARDCMEDEATTLLSFA